MITRIGKFYHLFASWNTTWHSFYPIDPKAFAKVWVSWIGSILRKTKSVNVAGKWASVPATPFWIFLIRPCVHYHMSFQEQWNPDLMQCQGTGKICSLYRKSRFNEFSGKYSSYRVIVNNLIFNVQHFPIWTIYTIQSYCLSAELYMP